MGYPKHDSQQDNINKLGINLYCDKVTQYCVYLNLSFKDISKKQDNHKSFDRIVKLDM